MVGREWPSGEAAQAPAPALRDTVLALGGPGVSVRERRFSERRLLSGVAITAAVFFGLAALAFADGL
jgi:hypothetical protein